MLVYCPKPDGQGVLPKPDGQGGPDNIQLERFLEAVHDVSSGLTYSALSGGRKQCPGCGETF